MVKWVASEVKKEDLKGLEQLTTITYGHMWKRSGNSVYYNWKLFGGNRPQPNGQVAYAEGQIVGYVASCHRYFHFGDETYWGTELGDVMTHPDYRRQGMFEALGTLTINKSMRSNYRPVYGFPNKAAYPIWIRKMSMEHFFNLHRLIMPLKLEAFKMYFPVPAFKLYFFIYLSLRNIVHSIMLQFGKSVRIERVDTIGEWADELWKKNKIRDEAGVVKDATYLRWRFDENADSYQIYRASDLYGKVLGFLVTKVRAEDTDKVFGFIADFLIPSRERFILHRLLDEAQLDFKKKGVILVDSWSTPNRFYLTALLSYGFLPVASLPFIVPIKQANELRSEGWGKSKKWVLSMADSDNV